MRVLAFTAVVLWLQIGTLFFTFAKPGRLELGGWNGKDGLVKGNRGVNRTAVQTISEHAVVRLPSGVRLTKDAVRERMVLLGPERALVMDSIAVAILGEIDGIRTVKQMIESLAATYAADPAVIGHDVKAFLLELANRRMLEIDL